LKSPTLGRYSQQQGSLVSTLDTTFPSLHLRDTVIIPRGKITCFAMSREFAYVHAKYVERVALHRKIQGGGLGSFCCALSLSDARHVVQARWGEWHLLAGSDGNPQGMIHVYCPRDVREAEICVGILEAACDFARQSPRQFAPLGAPGILREGGKVGVMTLEEAQAAREARNAARNESPGEDSHIEEHGVTFYDSEKQVPPPPMSPDVNGPYGYLEDVPEATPALLTGSTLMATQSSFAGWDRYPSPSPLKGPHSPGASPPPLASTPGSTAPPGSPIALYNDGVLISRSHRSPSSPPKSPFSALPKSPFLAMVPGSPNGMLRSPHSPQTCSTPMLFDMPPTPLATIEEDGTA